MLAHFHALISLSAALSFLPWNLSWPHPVSERLISDNSTSCHSGRYSQKYHLRYLPKLSLPICTLLMAKETGSGSCWYLGLADRGKTARQLTAVLGRNISSAQTDKVSYINWCIWCSLSGPFRCLALPVRRLSSNWGRLSIPVSHYIVENHFAGLQICQKI